MIVVNEIFDIEFLLYYTQEAVALTFLDYKVLYDVSKNNTDDRSDEN